MSEAAAPAEAAPETAADANAPVDEVRGDTLGNGIGG